MKRTAHPVLFQTVSKREVLEAVPILPLDSEHCIPFRKVIHPTVERSCPNAFLVIAIDRRERGHLSIFHDEQELFFPMKKIITMREMTKNQGGIIKRVSVGGDMGRRIREMGLVPNTYIQVQGRAPLKDPVAIKIRDFILTLRNNEADHILVEVDDPE